MNINHAALYKPCTPRSAAMMRRLAPLTRDHWMWCSEYGVTFRMDAEGEFHDEPFHTSRANHDPGDEDRSR